jgi:hypothetical protein
MPEAEDRVSHSEKIDVAMIRDIVLLATIYVAFAGFLCFYFSRTYLGLTVDDTNLPIHYLLAYGYEPIVRIAFFLCAFRGYCNAD